MKQRVQTAVKLIWGDNPNRVEESLNDFVGTIEDANGEVIDIKFCMNVGHYEMLIIYKADLELMYQNYIKE